MLANRFKRVHYIMFGYPVVCIQNDVIHGEYTLEQAVIIEHRQAAYLTFGHAIKCRDDVILGMARHDVACDGFPYQDVGNLTVLRRCRHANVAIGNHADDPPVMILHRQGTAVAFPHSHRHRGEIVVERAGLQRLRHDVFHIHMILL